MAIEQMLTEEMPASAAVARVLEETGIEMVFGISGGHTGRIVSGLSKYQNSIRTVLVREESLGGVMAEIYGRLTRRPGVLLGQGPWVLGNGLIGTLEAHLSSSPMLLLTDFSDAPRFTLHAPYQQATGDWGSWDARRALRGVTKHVMQAHDPIGAVQATQLAIKHALAGQPGPVALVFLNLDRLKAVNDHLGHKAGDRFIEAFAQLVSEAAGPSAIVARFGGDEFAGDDETFFVGETDGFAGTNGFVGGFESGDADDGADDEIDVGMRGNADGAFGAVQDFDGVGVVWGHGVGSGEAGGAEIGAEGMGVGFVGD